VCVWVGGRVRGLGLGCRLAPQKQKQGMPLSGEGDETKGGNVGGGGGGGGGSVRRGGGSGGGGGNDVPQAVLLAADRFSRGATPLHSMRHVSELNFDAVVKTTLQPWWQQVAISAGAGLCGDDLKRFGYAAALLLLLRL
jgi:hypothetical protein